jgi:hypothetical protein
MQARVHGAVGVVLPEVVVADGVVEEEDLVAEDLEEEVGVVLVVEEGELRSGSAKVASSFEKFSFDLNDKH